MSDDGGRADPPAPPPPPATDTSGGGAEGGDAPADAPTAPETHAPAAAEDPAAGLERSSTPELATDRESESVAAAGGLVAPKKWFELMPVVLERVRERGKEMTTQFGKPQCAKCSLGGSDSTRDAEIKCLTDGCATHNVPTCAACFIKAHTLLAGPGHRIQDLSKCPLCQLERLAYWCRDCDLDFCEACFSDIHSVRKARPHRRFAVEDSSGKCITKSNWSSHFHANVMQVLAVLKRPYSSDVKKPPSNASTSDGAVPGDSIDSVSIGKRKREVNPADVITIDSDNDSDSAGRKAPTTGFKRISSAPPTNSMIRPPSALHLRATASMTSTTGIVLARSAPQQLQYVEHLQNAAAPTTSQFQAGATQVWSASPSVPAPLPRPLPFPEELMTEGSPFASASTPEPIPFSSTSRQASPLNSVYNSTPMGMPSRGFNVAPIQTANVDSSTPRWATSSPATTPPVSVVSQSTPAEANMAGSAASGTMASYSMMPGAAAMNTDNPLLEAMIGRYDTQNHAVYELECRIQRLNEEIVQAASRGLYAAAPLMAELTNTQTTLRSALERRDRLFVISIVQSPDIIRKVRQIRLTEVMDVPQVPPLSHRKCLQLSFNINIHKSTLQTLNTQLANAISSSGMANANAVNLRIQQLSSSIAAHEQSMQQLIEDRHSEFVRIVQFSEAIREALKMEFRRYQQQQMQQQQGQPYHVP